MKWNIPRLHSVWWDTCEHPSPTSLVFVPYLFPVVEFGCSVRTQISKLVVWYNISTKRGNDLAASSVGFTISWARPGPGARTAKFWIFISIKISNVLVIYYAFTMHRSSKTCPFSIENNISVLCLYIKFQPSAHT